MIIDFRQLDPNTLDNLLAEISLRKGNDYGELEVPAEERKQRLLDRLDSGKAVIIYSPEDDFCDLVDKNEI